MAIGAGALTGGSQAKSLIKFDLSSIPSGSTISSATLELYCYANNRDFGAPAGSNPASVSAYK
ncbi:MAG: DNRLRE domain-containing protein, partial [Halobacteria archaeon]